LSPVTGKCVTTIGAEILVMIVGQTDLMRDLNVNVTGLPCGPENNLKEKSLAIAVTLRVVHQMPGRVTFLVLILLVGQLLQCLLQLLLLPLVRLETTHPNIFLDDSHLYSDGALADGKGQRTCFRLYYQTYREQETFQEVRTLKGEQVTCTMEDMYHDVADAETFDPANYCPFSDKICKPAIVYDDAWREAMTQKYCQFSDTWEWDLYKIEMGW